jgi:hypothetical protein
MRWLWRQPLERRDNEPDLVITTAERTSSASRLPVLWASGSSRAMIADKRPRISSEESVMANGPVL